MDAKGGDSALCFAHRLSFAPLQTHPLSLHSIHLIITQGSLSMVSLGTPLPASVAWRA